MLTTRGVTMGSYGKYVVFEGTDGCGKTTVADTVVATLREMNLGVFHTREPGSPFSDVTKAIREILKMKDHPAPLSELLLFMADRAHHYERVVMPELTMNDVVIQDRGPMSTLAYQGWGRGMPTGIINALNMMIYKARPPDLVVWIDTPIAVTMGRIATRNAMNSAAAADDVTMFNIRELQEKIHHGFEEIFKDSIIPMIRLDGTLSVRDLAGQARNAILNMMEE